MFKIFFGNPPAPLEKFLDPRLVIAILGFYELSFVASCGGIVLWLDSAPFFVFLNVICFSARAVEHTFVPYELLTMEEKEREWKGSHNFIKFLIVCGFQLTRSAI